MKKTGVLFGLATLLALSCLASCITTDHTLGSALVPANQDISIETATLNAPVGLKMADSLQTAISQSATVGAIRSDLFGLYHSDAAMSVTAAYDSIVWGNNPAVRSVSLTLMRDTSLMVDPGQRYIPQNLSVHRLKVELDSTMLYNNSLTAADYNPENLAKGSVIYTGTDEFTVPLQEKLGEELLKIPMATLDSAELFMKAFYGIYVRCDDPVEGTEGGRLNIFDLSSSYLTLVHEYDDEEGNRRITSNTFLVGDKYSVNICSSGARPLEKPDAFEILYLEGSCGIKPHISALELRDQVARWAEASQIPMDNLVIAKATLSLPFEYNGDYKQYDYYAGNVFPCKRVSTEGILRYTPIDEIQDDAVEKGDIDRCNLRYVSNISMYLQDLIRRDRSDITEADDIWLMPTITSYNSSTGATYYFADYFYYSQSLLNGTGNLRHPQIQLTYTTLK